MPVTLGSSYKKSIERRVRLESLCNVEVEQFTDFNNQFKRNPSSVEMRPTGRPNRDGRTGMKDLERSQFEAPFRTLGLLLLFLMASPHARKPALFAVSYTHLSNFT